MKLKEVFKCFIGFLILCMIPFTTYGIELTKNFDFYGFVKLDMHYQDGGMNSILAPRYAKPGEGNLTFTAANSRFGFKWKGKEIGKGWKIAAQLEWDFFYPGANRVTFRVRHANFTLTNKNSRFLFGQFRDVFAPLGPTTLMTNGYLWEVGNVGFWRAQVRYTYSSKNVIFAVSANDPTNYGAMKTEMPIIESRLGLNLGAKRQIKVGVSGAYGKARAVLSAGAVDDVKIMGACVDWHIPFGSLTLRGEFTFGENLQIFLSRSYVHSNVAIWEFEGEKVNSFWGQLVYEAKKYHFWVGYSFENLTEDEQLGFEELQDTRCIFAGIKLIVGGGVSIGLEYSNFLSRYFQVSEDDKTNQFILSFIYGF